MNHPDHELWQSAKAGDRSAFGALYDQHVREIYAYVYRRVLHKETAEDLTSVVFTKALDKLSQFHDRGEGSFVAWLYTIARTTVIDDIRLRGRTIALKDDAELPERTASARRMEAAVDAHAVLAALETLSATQRDIVLLRLWDERTFRDVATIVGKSEASCKMHYARALKLLRTSFVTLFALVLPHL